MWKFIFRIIFIFILALLQIFLFDRLPFPTYFYLSFYVSYIVLLSMKTSKYFVIISGAFLGIVIDILVGTHGLVTIATTSTAFVRTLILRNFISSELYQADRVPSIKNMGVFTWSIYAILLIITNNIVLCLFESGFQIFTSSLIFLRVLYSTLCTYILVLFVQYIVADSKKSSW